MGFYYTYKKGDSAYFPLAFYLPDLVKQSCGII